MSADASRKKMAAVGAYDTVLPFQAVGVRPFPVETDDEVAETVSRLAREDYGVIFVEERCFVAQASLIDGLVQEYASSIIPIPGIRGSIGVGLSSVRKSVERAVGMDIFAEK
jgi:V/A-type H+-transporting ATPase subunit F